MSTPVLKRNPVEFVARFIVQGVVYTTLVGLFSIMSVFIFYSSGQQAARLASLAVLGFGVMVTSNVLGPGDNNEYENWSRLRKIAALGLTVVYYHTAVFFAPIVALSADLVTSLSVAPLVAVAYPFWERVTGEYAVPLSVAGIFVWILAIGYYVHIAGREIVGLARKAVKQHDLETFGKFASPGVHIFESGMGWPFSSRSYDSHRREEGRSAQ